MKVLLSAYSCLPGGGSEPGIGWNWAKNIAASGHSVTVVTRAVNRKSIEDHLAGEPIQQLRFLFCDLPRFCRPIYKLPFGNYCYYFMWQIIAGREARKLHKVDPFELAQHITWGSYRVPSFMGSLGVPFVFGPVGGGEDTPKLLRRGLGPRGRLSDAMRRISGAILGLWMGSTYKSADEILVTTQETMENIPYRFRHKARVCQAVGIDAEDFNGSSVARVPDSSRLELLFVGRLLPWKGVHLLLQALSRDGLRDRQVRLTIIGSGPDRKRLDRLVNDLALQDKVHWIPWIPREELVRIYPKYDVFAFSSLHDSGGAAVLEAMANGLPVVCLDLGGPGVIVSNQCGRVVNTCASGEDQVVARLSRALEELDADRTLLSRLSAGASERVLHLSWRANVVTAHGNRWTRQSHPAENNSTLISSCSN